MEDFTEFEQRTAYFNGDPIRAMKKGMNILDRIPGEPHGAAPEHADFPPAPKLDTEGRLIAAAATRASAAGRRVFFGKGRCGACHPAPLYLDQQMHDLRVERFVDEPPRGPIKTFTLRGSRTARRTSTTAGCSRSRTRWSSSTWSSA